jgi:hypothetical protein
MWMSLVPASVLMYSPARWCEEPVPGDEKSTLSDFASLISSAWIVSRKARMRGQHQRCPGQQRDRRQILERIVRHVGKQILVERDLGRRSNQQRVAVGRTLGDKLRPDHAARAGLVLDDEILAERLAELDRQYARHQIGAAAGGVGHDDVDRPVRPILCRGGHRTNQQHHSSNQTSQHGVLRFGFLVVGRPAPPPVPR